MTLKTRPVKYVALVSLAVASMQATCFAEAAPPPQLRIGRAGHAFDHVGNIGQQAKAAAESGATIIYATGLGSLGYQGLPPAEQLATECNAIRAYNHQARQLGIELVIGYVCATSIVGLETFDKNWPAELRKQFEMPPSEWRQQDRNGQPLVSWYGDAYNCACMNNPDWRAYERFMVRQQFETGHDGIFFDNPTVHPRGCYCPHCMKTFAKFLRAELPSADVPPADSPNEVEHMRELAEANPREFLKFRSTIARDFLTHIRNFAKSVNPDALITCNNSLNSPDALYSQSRAFGYNIAELSKAEDFVVVEDMVSQPRVEVNGHMLEYGPTYKQLHAINHDKPIVAVTLAQGDYHTAPNLVRLAMAEAAAHDASYLSWPTWPEEQRQRMISAIRPQAELLRRSEPLLNDAKPRADAMLFLPMRRWLEMEKCLASDLAAALSAANIQYKVVSEEGFAIDRDGQRPAVFVVESLSVLTPDEKSVVDRFQSAGGKVVAADEPDWLAKVKSAIEFPSVAIEGPPTIRAVVHDQPKRTIVHVYNLNVTRVSSFEDQVTSATDVQVSVMFPSLSIRSATIHTADASGTNGPVPITAQPVGDETRISFRIPKLQISAFVVIE